MIEKIKRPLSDKEKRALNSKASSIKLQTKLFYKRLPIVMVVITGVLWGWTMLAAKASPVVITLVWVCIGLAISLWILIEEKQKCSRRMKSIKEALARNEADVIHIKSTEMVEFAEIEDEGAGYAFQIDNETIVFVAGQDFYSSANFPNDEFEIIRICDLTGNLVEILIEKHGNKLKPVRKISIEVKKCLRTFAHLETVRGKLADLEQILKAD